MLVAGTGPAHAAAPEKHPGVVAGDNCAASIKDVAACRAAQETCLAMAAASAQQGPADGAPPPAQMPEVPPLTPKDEAPGDPLHPVAERCEAQAQDLLVSRLHGEVGRVLITRSSRWNLIWRADVSTPLEGGGRYVQRVVCVEGAFLISPAIGVGQDLPPLP